MLNLEEEIILFDNSVSSSRQFMEKTHEIKHPEEIPTEEITQALKVHQDFFMLLTQPNTFTIQEVKEQYKKFLEIISERMTFYDHIARRTGKSENHNLYRQLGQIVNKNMIKLARKIYAPINKEKYKPLQELVNSLDTRRYINQTNKNIVTTALYAETIDSKKTAIITGDGTMHILIQKLKQQQNNTINLYMQRDDSYKLV